MKTKSPQDLRERRAALVAQARKLIEDNPGNRWTSVVSDKVDSLYAEVDGIDRNLHEIDRALRNGLAEHAADAAFVDTVSGAAIPVAYGNRGSITAQLAAQGYTPAPGQVTMADFLRGVAGGKTSETVRAALSEGTDSAGGHMLRSSLQVKLLEALVPASTLLTAGAGVAMLTDGAKSYKVAAISTVPTAAWRNEAGTLATSDPVFRGIDVVPRSLAFTFKVSRELLNDAANIEQALMTAIAQSFAKELDRAGLRGTGTAPEIRGVLNTSGIQAVTNGANGASLATTAYANLVSAVNSILAADGPMPTAAIMAPRSLTTLGGLLDTTNQPRRVPPMLEGVKFIPTSQIPINLTVGTSTDCSEIYLADFTNAVYFMRERMSVQILRELYAGTGEIGFACHVRADFAALYPAAFAVVTGVRA